MSNIVNIPTQLHKQATPAELMRLRAMIVSVRQQLDWIDSTMARPATSASARSAPTARGRATTWREKPTDHIYPAESKDHGRRAEMKRTTCKTCSHCYLEMPKRIAHICAHPEMWKRFDVTPFVKRDEYPKRCPVEVR